MHLQSISRCFTVNLQNTLLQLQHNLHFKLMWRFRLWMFVQKGREIMWWQTQIRPHRVKPRRREANRDHCSVTHSKTILTALIKTVYNRYSIIDIEPLHLFKYIKTYKISLHLMVHKVYLSVSVSYTNIPWDKSCIVPRSDLIQLLYFSPEKEKKKKHRPLTIHERGCHSFCFACVVW